MTFGSIDMCVLFFLPVIFVLNYPTSLHRREIRLSLTWHGSRHIRFKWLKVNIQQTTVHFSATLRFNVPYLG